MKKVAIACILIVLPLALSHADSEAATSHRETILSIAADIEKLKPDYPQLEAFSADNAADPLRLSITYGFKTHKAEHIGGWTSGVPNPDDDGIWFYIDLHDADSAAQIHTQPMTANVLLGGMNVQLLILEGEQTKRASGAIWKIIMAHGAEERPHGRETVANLEVEPTENNAAGSLRAAKP